MQPLHPCMFPPDILEAMRSTRERDRTEFTPSSLLECDRRTVLSAAVDTWMDIDQEWRMFRGTLIHQGMDTLGRFPEESLCDIEWREKRIKTTLSTCYGPQVFSGKADCIAILRVDDAGVAHAKVMDYKTTARIEPGMTRADRKHQMQINMYGYLARIFLTHDLGYRDAVIDELEIIYLSDGKVRRFTSAGELSAKGKETKKTEPKEWEPITLEPITLLPVPTVEAWIIERIEAKITAKRTLPPMLEGDAAKICFWCPVRDACYERGDAA